MSEAACKAAICDNKAMSLMNNACDDIISISEASFDLRIKHSEIYIKYMKKAKKEAAKAVIETGE